MTPTRLSMRLFALLGLLGIPVVVWPQLADLWLGALGLLGAALLVDLMLQLRKPPIRLQRTVAGSLALGARAKVELRVYNDGRAIHRVVLHDHHPIELEVEGLPAQVKVAPGQWTAHRYVVRPVERGEHSFGPIVGRWASPLRLWHRTLKTPTHEPVRVYPNFRAVAKFALLAVDSRISELGIKKRRRRGQGMEFHQLREYRVGDSLRQIDWKATSKIRKLISREYRDERNQQVVFLLDCGRRMHAKDGDLSHLDHSLDAVLLLSYVALRQGDAVGLMTFGGQHRWLAPRKGPGFLKVLLNSTYDLATTTAASDTYAAVTEATRRLRKRSMVVLVSNMRDENDQEVAEVMKIARHRHLVLLASLRERIIGQKLKEPVLDFDDALRVGATYQYLRARQEAHARLTRAGVICMDVEPQVLPAALVNRYLAIKASGVL